MNVIVAPRKLLWDSPVKRLAAYYHSSGEIQKIKIYEHDKEDLELKDVDLKEISPSKEELMDIEEITIEVDFGVFNVMISAYPKVTMKQICCKLSELFGNKMKFIPVCRGDEGWLYDSNIKAVDFFLKDGEHLIFPELLEIGK